MGGKTAFSLLEVLVVALIIGVVAAIAVPRLSRASGGTDEKVLRSNLRILRGAIELYAAEHGGAFPGYHKIDGKQKADGKEADFYAQLLQCSTATGLAGSCTPPRIFGPYLREIPSLNIGRNSESDRKPNEVKFKTEDPLDEHEGDKTGWIYNPKTGEIIANTKDVDCGGTPYKAY